MTSYDIVQNGVPIGQSARKMLRVMKTHRFTKFDVYGNTRHACLKLVNVCLLNLLPFSGINYQASSQYAIVFSYVFR